eukprot:TRINITY_DN4023_c0_g1_i1.p1 TRINITY_DN4023_c0_g1~~TRINITY_DN4023_c0_g1_i1.p1  ORF type:complete len:362 (+),score=87.70 TRINITY_DN4023_c0_g1_i1:117-1202(+)
MAYRQEVLAPEAVEEPTALMIRNLPARSSQQEVLDAIHKLGFEGDYDFFYLPMRLPFERQQNHGYAFINFVTPKKAADFIAKVSETEIVLRSSLKVLSVVPAHLQGKDSLVKHFKNRSVSRTCWAPIFKGDESESVTRSQKKNAKKSKKPSGGGARDDAMSYHTHGHQNMQDFGTGLLEMESFLACSKEESSVAFRGSEERSSYALTSSSSLHLGEGCCSEASADSDDLPGATTWQHPNGVQAKKTTRTVDLDLGTPTKVMLGYNLEAGGRQSLLTGFSSPLGSSAFPGKEYGIAKSASGSTLCSECPRSDDELRPMAAAVPRPSIVSLEPIRVPVNEAFFLDSRDPAMIFRAPPMVRLSF